MKGNKYLVLALVLALVTSVYLYNYLVSLDKREKVVVARRDLDQYSRLDRDDIKVSYLPVEAVHPEAVRETETVLGKHLLVPVTAGEQILRDKVDFGTGEEGFLGKMEPGLRAVMIPTDPGRALGGAIKPNARVDVVFVGEDEMGMMIAKTLLQKVPVLDVKYAGGSTGGRSGAEDILGVIVGVPPLEVERILFALETGEVYLALDPYEAVVIPTPGVSAVNLLQGGSWNEKDTPLLFNGREEW